MLSLKYVFSGSVFVIQTSNDRTFYLKNGLIMWTTNFSPDWPEGVANQRRRSQSEGRKSWRKMWEIAVWIKLKWGRLKESGSQTPQWEKTSRVSKPWGRFFGSKKRAPSVSEPEHKEQISLCPPLSKAHPILGSAERIWKGIGSVFLSPHRRNNARATVWTWKCFIWEQPCVSHRLDVMHSEGGGGDWRLCSR